MQESIETLRAELEERLRFETLLAEASARLVNLPPDRGMETVEKARSPKEQSGHAGGEK